MAKLTAQYTEFTVNKNSKGQLILISGNGFAKVHMRFRRDENESWSRWRSVTPDDLILDRDRTLASLLAAAVYSVLGNLGVLIVDITSAQAHRLPDKHLLAWVINTALEDPRVDASEVVRIELVDSEPHRNDVSPVYRRIRRELAK